MIHQAPVLRRARRLASRALAAALGLGALTLSHAPSAGEPRPGGTPRDRSAPPVVTFSTTAVPSMSTVRWYHAAVTMTDGRVLVAGGHPTGDSMTSAEIFDPKTGQWTRTAPMLHVHDWPVAAPMCDGRVFVGGRVGATKEAEIYDPAADQWIDAGQMKYRHIYGQATLLQDCRILLSGGYDANTRAEIYDPSTNMFHYAGTMNSERFFHTATLLADGRVLAAGGGVDANGVWYTYKTADIWDPATGKWTKARPLVGSRRAHTATRLPDGRVLVTGGTFGGKNDGTQGGTQIDSAEIYDPAADTWEKLEARLVTPRGLHTAALVPSGAVLLFGGLDATGSASREVETFFQGAFWPLQPLLSDRLHHASAQLADGRVLVTGGVHQATAEIYALGQPGDPCDSDVVCAGGICADGVCCDEPCDGGCRRCDVPGRQGTCSLPCAGDDHALACSDGSATCAEASCVAVPCAPYRCDADQGSCFAECRSVEDCAPGFACDLQGQCVSPPDVSASDEGCRVATPGAGPRAAWSLLAWSAALAALARRRQRPSCKR